MPSKSEDIHAAVTGVFRLRGEEWRRDVRVIKNALKEEGIKNVTLDEDLKGRKIIGYDIEKGLLYVALEEWFSKEELFYDDLAMPSVRRFSFLQNCPGVLELKL